MVVSRKMDAKLEALEKRVEERMGEERRAQTAAMQEAIADLWQKLDEKLSRRDESNDNRDSTRPNRSDSRNSGSEARSENEEGSASRRGFGAEQWRRIELPLFQGEDAPGWVDRIERYFQIRGVPPEEWLTAAKVAVEGQALTWFHWWEATAAVHSWPRFREAVVKRFQPEVAWDPYSALLALKQEGTVREYRDRFEALSRPQKIEERKYLRSLFLNGLKEEVRAEVKIHKYDTLDEMIDLAEVIDDRNRLISRGPNKGYVGGNRETTWPRNPLVDKGGSTLGFSGGSRGPTHVTSGGNSGSISSTNNRPEGRNNEGISRNYKQMSDAEYRERRSKGLCFACDERYTPEHVCKNKQNKQFRFLIIEEEVDTGGEGEWQDALEELGGAMNSMQLKVSELQDNGGMRSIRIWGLIARERVRVMIDIGASHNFICQNLVQRLGLPVLHTSEFSVKVGNGQQVRSMGVCKAVRIQFPELVVEQNLFLFPVEGAEVVLGLAWLDTLGDVRANFKECKLQFRLNGVKVALRGDSDLCYGGFPTNPFRRHSKRRVTGCWFSYVHYRSQNHSLMWSQKRYSRL